MTAKKKDSFSWLAEWNGNISLIYTGFNQMYLHSFYNSDILHKSVRVLVCFNNSYYSTTNIESCLINKF